MHQIARKGSKLGTPGTPLTPAVSTAQTITALVVPRGFLCQEFKPSSDTQMKSYPLTAAFVASTCHRLSHGGPWSIPHLHFQHQDCMTQGRRTGSSWLLQRGARVDFSQGMLSSGGPCEPAELSTCITREYGDQAPPGLPPGMAFPSLHLCFILFFF